MSLFRSERGIGRGEVAESRREAPLFAVFMVGCSLFLFFQHLYFNNLSATLAMAVSMMVFGTTVIRVDFGVYILIIAMLLSPEIHVQNTVTGERELNLRYDDILILVIFLGVMVKLAFEGRLSLWQPSPVNAGILFYFAVCIVSTLLALERNLGAWDRRDAFFTMLKMLEYYMVFWLVGQATATSDQARRQLGLFFVVALIVSLYAIYSIRFTPRVSAPFEQGGTEPNTLGGYLVLVICVAFGLSTQAPKRFHRWFFLAVCCIAFVPLLYTLSRASYGALVTGVVVLSAVSRKLMYILVLGVVLASSQLLLPDKVMERISYTFQEHGEEIVVAGRETGIKVDKSTHERILVWRKTRYILTLGLPYFLLGGGVSWESVLDSQYARIFLETGVLGFIAFTFLQFRLLRSARESYRWTEDWVGRGLGMGVFAATIALMVHSAGTISFLIVRIMEPYWFLVALTVVYRNHALRTYAEERDAEAHAGNLAKADTTLVPVQRFSLER